jgi:hypothetical protein
VVVADVEEEYQFERRWYQRYPPHHLSWSTLRVTTQMKTVSRRGSDKDRTALSGFRATGELAAVMASRSVAQVGVMRRRLPILRHGYQSLHV